MNILRLVKIENTNLIKDAYHTFMKEEQVLYPMAEKLFSEEEKETFKQRVTEVKKVTAAKGNS